MRTVKRLQGLQAWVAEKLCAGRILKTPAPSQKVAEATYTEPHVSLIYENSRVDATGWVQNQQNTAPGILIMLAPSAAKADLEQRFDRYAKVHRSPDMARTLNVQMLFTVYESGMRLDGFAESAETPAGPDMERLLEGTQQGVMTVLDWMDDAVEELTGAKAIPGTDLVVDEESITYSLYSDQNYVVDKRPFYYGLVTARFLCRATERTNKQVTDLLL